MQEALADYQAALKLQPGFIDAQYNLANLFSATQRHEDAITAYNKILLKDNLQIDAFYNRGNAYKKLNKY